jgi:hypothetical protein
MQILRALRWQLFLSMSAESLYSQKIAEVNQRGERLTQEAAERGVTKDTVQILSPPPIGIRVCKDAGPFSLHCFRSKTIC